MHKPLFLNFPITKIDEEQRIVYGIATSEAIDSQGDVIDYEASKKAFSSWMGNIREMHQPVAVGKAIDIEFDDDTKTVTIGAKISESADGENAWLKVKEGVLTGFSIGGSVAATKTDVVKDGDTERTVRRIVDYGLSETSLVDNPANPEALFSMVKSVDGGLQRVEAMEDPGHPHLPAWYGQFMLPIEKAQALYDEDMNKRDRIEKAGAAVVDSDPRDANGNTVSETTPTTPKKGGTPVTRDIYGKDGKTKTTVTKAQRDELRKSVSDAAWLASIAQQLVSYIFSEDYEGEEADLEGLKAALSAIQSAVAQEVQEGDDFEVTDELIDYVYYAQQATNLKKGTGVKKANVVAGVERDVNGNEVTETVVEETSKTEVVEEDPKKEVVVEEQPKEEVPAKTEATTETDEAKTVTIGDLQKFSDALIAKLGDHQESGIEKALGEFTGKVEKSLTALEDRVKHLEAQPTASKVKASYVDVTKGGEGGEKSEMSESDVKELVKRRDELAVNPNLGTMDERIALTKQLRKANSLGLLKD